MQELQTGEQPQVVGYGIWIIVIMLLAAMMGSIIYVVLVSSWP